jgi:hypothetical protein
MFPVATPFLATYTEQFISIRGATSDPRPGVSAAQFKARGAAHWRISE